MHIKMSRRTGYGKNFHSLKRSPLFSSLFFVSCSLLLLINILPTMTALNAEIPEAQQVALESCGELLAPDALVQRIEKDLKAIRTQFPAVQDVKNTPKWQPGRVMVRNTNMTELNAVCASSIGPGESKAIFQDKIYMITFEKPYNPEKLAEKLKTDFNLNDVQPDGIIGGSSYVHLTSDPSGKNTYKFMKGWGDCMSGCINKHFWTFTAGPEENSVSLVEETGDDLSGAAEGRPIHGGGMGLMGLH